MPWINKNEWNALLHRIDRLAHETEELRKQTGRIRKQLDDSRIKELLSASVEHFFQYQNNKMDGFAAYFSSKDKIFRFVMEGVSVSFYLPMAASDRVQQDILRTSYFYQPKALNFIRRENILTKSATVIDAGANIGNHTIFFGKIMGAMSIHSFEPNPPAYSILERNVELNSLAGVVCLHHTGLGEAPSKARNLNNRSNNLGGNQIIEDENGEVAIERIDDLRLKGVDFIKIDVEGRGDGVINGGIEVISRDRPAMLVEETSVAEKKTIAMLKSDFGYREIWRNKMDLILVP